MLRNVDVRIHDPVTHDNKSMRTLIEHLFYNIRFWEDPPSPQVDDDSTLPCFGSSSADTC